MGNWFSLHMPTHYVSIFNYLIIYKTSVLVVGALQHHKQKNPREEARWAAVKLPIAFDTNTAPKQAWFLVILEFPGEKRHLFQDLEMQKQPANTGIFTLPKPSYLWILNQAHPKHFLVGLLLSSFPLFSLPQEEHEGWLYKQCPLTISATNTMNF